MGSNPDVPIINASVARSSYRRCTPRVVIPDAIGFTCFVYYKSSVLANVSRE